MPTARTSVYDFDTNLTETRLTAFGEYRPFRAREAFLLARRLGRPLTESEMSQFEYPETNSSNAGVNIPEEVVGAYSNIGSPQRREAVLV